jgi:hypothetical protein
LGSGDFTIEFWAYFNDVTTAQKTLITRRNALSNYAPYYLGCDTSSRITFFASSNGSSYDVANNLTFGSLTTNRWYHIALVRNGSQFTGYIDGAGTSLLTSSATLYNNSQSLVVGAETDPTFEHDGFISNLRIIKGTALYTSNFTPPTKQLTAITNTTLLTCQGNTIADASSSAHTITANGDISLTKEPFAGAGAVSFDGTGDYLDIGSSTDFAFGTGDFTIEVWVYLKSNTLGVIYSNEVSDSLFLYLSSGNLVVRNYGTINLFDLTSPSLNTWTHIALSRSGTDLRLFFNGVQQGGTVTNSTNWTQNGTEIGAFNNGTQSLNGYLSNLRIVKGTALYTSNFTPPTKQLTAVTNTELLTCQGQNIKDASSNAHTITVNGDAKATIVSSAFEFDGSNDYITTNTNANFTLGASIGH